MSRSRWASPSGRTTNYGYDAADRLTSIDYSSGAPKALYYSYDADGQLKSMTDRGGSSSFGYDSLGRLVSSSNGRGQTLRYGYDVADRLTSLVYPQALTPLNRATGAGLNPVATGTVTRGYDEDGNLISVGVDQADQLTSYSGPDRARPGQSATASYSYDATGLRSARTVNGVERTQTWDRSGTMPVLIADGPRAYITGPDGRPIEQILADGSVRYYHQDHHGSTRALTNHAVGALDAPTFGLTSKALGEIGINVDTCSGFYTGGSWAPIGGPLSILGKGAKLARLGRSAGGLTRKETRAIQDVVDDAGRPLDVVGSAARRSRRGAGSKLPIGKGPGTRSDIDYLVPHSSLPHFRGLDGRLPSVDPRHGVIPGSPNPSLGPNIRFEPRTR